MAVRKTKSRKASRKGARSAARKTAAKKTKPAKKKPAAKKAKIIARAILLRGKKGKRAGTALLIGKLSAASDGPAANYDLRWGYSGLPGARIDTLVRLDGQTDYPARGQGKKKTGGQGG